MGRLISLPCDPHRETQELLPWYVTGALDDDDRWVLEAHLGNCAGCRAELAVERRLAEEVSALPLGSEAGWTELRRSMAGAPPRGVAIGQVARAFRAALARQLSIGWVLAGQAAIAVLLAVALLPHAAPPPAPAPYRTLGAAPVPASGNVIVIFRPDSREADMRRALDANAAQLVAGPTPAGAYLLRVSSSGRDAVLAALRNERAIVLAQPIDPGALP